MKRQFIVTTEAGYVTLDDKTWTPESFAAFALAEERADELARRTPGETFRVYGLLTVAKVSSE